MAGVNGTSLSADRNNMQMSQTSAVKPESYLIPPPRSHGDMQMKGQAGEAGGRGTNVPPASKSDSLR